MFCPAILHPAGVSTPAGSSRASLVAPGAQFESKPQAPLVWSGESRLATVGCYINIVYICTRLFILKENVVFVQGKYIYARHIRVLPLPSLLLVTALRLLARARPTAKGRTMGTTYQQDRALYRSVRLGACRWCKRGTFPLRCFVSPVFFGLCGPRPINRAVVTIVIRPGGGVLGAACYTFP